MGFFCEAGIILVGKDFIKATIQQDIFNLSGYAAWLMWSLYLSFFRSSHPGTQTLMGPGGYFDLEGVPKFHRSGLVHEMLSGGRGFKNHSFRKEALA